MRAWGEISFPSRYFTSELLRELESEIAKDRDKPTSIGDIDPLRDGNHQSMFRYKDQNTRRGGREGETPVTMTFPEGYRALKLMRDELETSRHDQKPELQSAPSGLVLIRNVENDCLAIPFTVFPVPLDTAFIVDIIHEHSTSLYLTNRPTRAHSSWKDDYAQGVDRETRNTNLRLQPGLSLHLLDQTHDSRRFPEVSTAVRVRNREMPSQLAPKIDHLLLSRVIRQARAHLRYQDRHQNRFRFRFRYRYRYRWHSFSHRYRHHRW